jgi:peptidoglycan/xylan/chitin deacetylase (PgdA/CDA1 family)
MTMRLLLHALSPPAARARLSILIFHRVLPAPDPLFPGEQHGERFDRLCTWVRRWFNVVALDEACRRLAEHSLPARALAITFDDGYADNHDVAVPILRRHGLPATVFVATGFLDGGRMWNDSLVEAVRLTRHEVLDLQGAGLPGVGRLSVNSLAERRTAIDRLIGACRYLPSAERSAAVEAVARAAAAELPRMLMMSSAQVQALHAQGIGIGAHTVNHPILTRLPLDAAREEIRAGRETLQALIQAPVSLFAYPNGRPGEDFAASHVSVVRELSFAAAVTTAWGVADHATDRFQLPRFTPWDEAPWAFGLRMARNIGLRRPTASYV